MATFWLLNGKLGWRTADGSAQGVAFGESDLRLTAEPGGPLSLLSPDGSLGGTLLPRGMAIDERDGALYLLQNRAPWHVLRYDPAQEGREEGFTPLPGIGGPSEEGELDARHFRQPAQIAVAGGNLYVADPGSGRVQVFSLPELALLDVWHLPGWSPADVFTQGGWVYVLDAAHGEVFRARVQGGRLRLLFRRKTGAGQPVRIAVDREQRLYLIARDGQDAWAEVYDLHDEKFRQKPPAILRDASALDDRFDPPAVKTAYTRVRGQPNLLRGYFRPPGSQSAFSRSGAPVRIDPAELLDVAPFRRSGTWISKALDSQIYQCQWHRVELELGEFPPGTSLTISTYTADAAEDPTPRSPASPFWKTAFRLAAPPEGPVDMMVQSPPGQYLWLMLDFGGDGFGSPVVSGLRVHYPRESYLDYLPTIFKGEESRSFLERFLAIFQTEWDDLEKRLDTLAALFDPRAVPAGPFLDQLAAWIGLPVEDSWDYEQKRNMLISAAQIYPHRGTPASLLAYLQAYLQNITGLTPGQQGPYPRLVEGFRERRHLELVGQTSPEQPLSPLGRANPLWSPDVVGRLQVGVYAEVGEARLVSTGSPQFDLFHEYAHRFRVYIPSTWVRTRADEDMIRRALDEEKPAHTAYDLRLVEPRFILERQSTIGLDTILGEVPAARLVCQEYRDKMPAGQMRHRLGYDMVLGGQSTRVPRIPRSLQMVLP